MGYTPLDQLQELYKATVEAQTELYHYSSSKTDNLPDTFSLYENKRIHVHTAGNTRNTPKATAFFLNTVLRKETSSTSTIYQI